MSDPPASAPPPREPLPPPHRPRNLLAAIIHDAAPLDLQLLGRVLLHAIVVGAAAGAMACGLYYLLELGQALALGYATGYESLRAAGEIDVAAGRHTRRPWLLPLIPAVGAFLASHLAQRLAPECEGAGADAAIGAFHQKVSQIRRRVVWIKPLTTLLTIATGGAGGREGPTMQIGGAIGSTVGRYLRLSPREKRILLVAGMAAGVSAIFRTPLGAALLSVELLYRDDFEADAVVPAVLASVVGYSVFIWVHGDATLFETAAAYPFVISHLPLYGLMTLVVSAGGALFVRSLRQMEQVAKRWPSWARAGLGGLGVGTLALVYALLLDDNLAANALGGGYGAAQAAIVPPAWLGTGLTAAITLALLGVTKMLGASLTVGTGGSAGAFAPSIAIGATLGGAFGQLATVVFDDPSLDPGAFALVGMGALYGGIAHAPLGSLVMVCEMAGSYDLLVPLMLAEGIAFVVMRKHSLYRAQVPRQANSPAHPPRVLEVLSSLRVESVMSPLKEYASFTPATPIAVVMQRVSEQSWQDVFPVVDATGALVGMITPELLRLVAAERDLEPWIVAADTMQAPVTIHVRDNLRAASERMLTHGLRELVVIDDDARICGFLDEQELGQIYLKHLN